MEYISFNICPICEYTELTLIGTRVDGINVMQCQRCHMGFVEKYPVDITAYYDNAYYQGHIDDTEGYHDYDMTAAHSLSWVAYLVQLWNHTGNVLDIGCADGYLLDLLGASYRRFGIEVNPEMSDTCRSKGFTIIGDDIQEDSLLINFTNRFQIITGIAVLEHVPNLRLTLERIHNLLATDGIFIFEVPLISEANDNATWYKSSLEHIYYPTIEGLEYLFAEIFKLPLLGIEAKINEYGSTYVGLVARDQNTYKQLNLLYNSLFISSNEVLPDEVLPNDQVLTFKFLFGVVHRADTQQINLLQEIDYSILSPALIKRLSILWQRDVQLRNLYLTQGREQAARLEEARDYYANQAQNWQNIAEGRSETVNQLLSARDYFAQQAQNWQALAEERTGVMYQFEEARDFHEQQSHNWQNIAKEVSAQIVLLQEAVAYHAEQARNWQQLAETNKQLLPFEGAEKKQ